jgi:hypothetical protein
MDAGRLPPLEPDPVIEAYKKDIDRSLLRERLKRTPDRAHRGSGGARAVCG